MANSIQDIIDFEAYPLHDEGFIDASRRTLDETGALLLPQFIQNRLSAP